MLWKGVKPCTCSVVYVRAYSSCCFKLKKRKKVVGLTDGDRVSRF